MPEYLFDQYEAKKELSDFFKNEKADISNFGSTVNQTFEAFVFANVSLIEPNLLILSHCNY